MNRSFVGILTISTLVVILLLLLYLVGTRTSFFNMASTLTPATTTTQEVPSSTGNSTYIAIGNSYIFASPLKAKANGQEKIRVTVFALDGQGNGVAGAVVSLGGVQGLSISPVQPTTDDLGRAIFDISSITAGNFEISASVGTSTIPQRVTMTFGN